ncbi:hypothetical protein ACF1GY_05535 [Streptomyces sp. NPDC014684]|uniref:hypothetical protein n=1 Tax=Streptomyces sp. NPDC014684 TaxID=3364880 RepID=UPI0036FF7D2E
MPGKIWVRVGDRYYYSWGTHPDGTHRLVELTEPPWGQRVWVPDLNGGTGTNELAPFRLRPSTRCWLLLVPIALILIPLNCPGGALVATIATILATGFLLFCALCAQGWHLHPQDDIARAEAREYHPPEPWTAEEAAYYAAQYHAAQQQAAQQAHYQQQMLQWQRAIWAQQVSVDQALHPGQDVWRPCGQSPPL